MLPVLLLTLLPSDTGPGSGWSEELRTCLLCGDRAAADAVLNAALFAPLGWVIGRARGPWTALLCGAAVSVGIEVVQLTVPGRFTSAVDVLANGAGAGVGGWIGGRRRFPARLASAASAVALLAPAFLLAPAPPGSVYYGQWTARLGHMVPYRGEVLEAVVGTTRTPPWRSGHSAELRRAVLDGGPVRVRMVVGPPPPSPAPIFSVFDDRQREIFMLGADGEDLFVRFRRRSDGARLAAPTLWWRDALDAGSTGDTITVAFARERRSPCLTARGRTHCRTASDVAGGWSVLAPSGLDARVDRAIGLFWALTIGIPLGLLPGGTRTRALATGALLAAAASSSLVLWYWPTPWTGLAAVAVGAAAGSLAGRTVPALRADDPGEHPAGRAALRGGP